MNIEDALFNRRSIRKYTSQKLNQKLVIDLIKAGMYAPSAVNKRPWHFILIDDRDKMNAIMDIHQNSKMLTTASHAILVCGDEKLQHDDGFWIADCGAATQNILLAAYGKGIGSCWIGIYPREKRMQAVKEIFNLPEHIQPFAIVSLGIPAEVKSFPERFEQNKIRFNQW